MGLQATAPERPRRPAGIPVVLSQGCAFCLPHFPGANRAFHMPVGGERPPQAEPDLGGHPALPSPPLSSQNAGKNLLVIRAKSLLGRGEWDRNQANARAKYGGQKGTAVSPGLLVLKPTPRRTLHSSPGLRRGGAKQAFRPSPWHGDGLLELWPPRCSRARGCCRPGEAKGWIPLKIQQLYLDLHHHGLRPLQRQPCDQRNAGPWFLAGLGVGVRVRGCEVSGVRSLPRSRPGSQLWPRGTWKSHPFSPQFVHRAVHTCRDLWVQKPGCVITML